MPGDGRVISQACSTLHSESALLRRRPPEEHATVAVSRWPWGRLFLLRLTISRAYLLRHTPFFLSQRQALFGALRHEVGSVNCEQSTPA